MRNALDIEKFHRPKTVQETIGLLTQQDGGAVLIAGGTDLLPRRQGGRTGITKNGLVDISGLGLNYIRETQDAFLIGAATDINTLASSPVFNTSPYTVMIEAALFHSTLTLRNRATLGGNLCNASPHADLALPLLLLDAVLVIEGPHGQKTIHLDNFFTGPHCTVLEPMEILTEIRIPRMTEKSGANFIKLTRQHTAIDMAVVNATTCLSIKDGICVSARIALGSVGPHPFRAKKAEALLLNHAPEAALFRESARLAAKEASPIDDIRATAAYRKEMIPVLLQQSLEKSLERSLS
ncbi:MAG: FAD binding domain-containing protein [Desulfobacula sp.]|jgi:carbon-monoxide dehydrogenase medium subunit